MAKSKQTNKSVKKCNERMTEYQNKINKLKT